MRSDIEQTRLIVCERPLQEHTHTSALVTTPRATENDAPKYSVYVCVVCVGGVRSIENILLSQRVPNSSQHDPQARKQESQYVSSSVYIYNVYINVKSPLQM